MITVSIYLGSTEKAWAESDTPEGALLAARTLLDEEREHDAYGAKRRDYRVSFEFEDGNLWTVPGDNRQISGLS